MWKAKDGSIFVGEWKENRRHGTGKFTETAGTTTTQVWKDGIQKQPGIRFFGPELPDPVKYL
jgi:hypothetical protein